MAEGKDREAWLAFAIVMALIAGSANAVFGLFALFVKEGLSSESLLFLSLRQWGWVLIVVGVLQFVVGFLLSSRKDFGRILGIVLAVLSLLAWLPWTGAMPLAGMTVVVIDILVIYALSVAGELFA